MRLERLDVRVKIASFVAVMVALFAITHPLGNGLLLLGMLLTLAAAGTPLRGLWAPLQPLLPLLLLIVAVTMVTSPRAEYSRLLFAVGGVHATVGGLLVGLNLAMRILVMVVATYAFTISTPVDDLLAAMAQVHAPPWLSILVSTAISFIPTMTRVLDRIVEAQRARGARAGGRGPVGRVAALVPIMVPLITSSILLADNLAVAMTNRGYGARKSMTQLRDLSFRRSDLVVLAVVLVLLATILWLRYVRGYGVL